MINREKLTEHYRSIGLTGKAIKSILKSHKRLLKLGLRDGRERVCIVDCHTGRIVLKKTGTANYIAWDMKDITSDLVIVIHNHPSDSPFSITDLSTFSKWGQIWCIVAQGHGGAFYILSKKGKGVPHKLSINELKTKMYDMWSNKEYAGASHKEKNIFFVKEIAKKANWNFFEGGA